MFFYEKISREKVDLKIKVISNTNLFSWKAFPA